MQTDCGELHGTDYDNAAKTAPDRTGDPYEDYPEDQNAELPNEEIIKVASLCKDLGNSAFKDGEIALALAKYLKGLRYLREPDYPDNDENNEANNENVNPASNTSGTLDAKVSEQFNQIATLQTTLHLNAALAQLKLNHHGEAYENANSALQERYNNKPSEADQAKAYFRRGLASVGKKNDEEALADLEAALKLKKDDPAIGKELEAVRKRVTERKQKEKRAYSKYFS